MTAHQYTERSRIPAAVAAVVAAVVEEHPRATPDEIGWLTVAELSDQGWNWHLGHMARCSPSDAPTTSAPELAAR